MKILTFIDTEVSAESNKILDIGAIKSSGERMHEGNVDVLLQFVEKRITCVVIMSYTLI